MEQKQFANTGTVFQIQHFCTDDGPGIRTTVFLKGCHLSCGWCHNPEGKSKKPIVAINLVKCVKCGLCQNVCPNHQISADKHSFNANLCTACGKCIDACPVKAIAYCGKTMSVDEVMEEIVADIGFFQGSGGGMTVSGGELLLQPEFSKALLKKAQELGIHTCIETTGAVKFEILQDVAQYVDLILYDIKETDSENHKKYIGVKNDLIIENLKKLNKINAKVVMRCPIIPGVNDRLEHLEKIADLFNELECVQNVQLLPYHELGSGKQDRYGLKMETEEFRVPNKEEVASWNEYLNKLLKRERII